MKQRIKELRLITHLTQQEFADRLEITKPSVSKMESGALPISRKMVTNICRTFNVNRRWLETGKGEVFSTAGDDLIPAVQRVMREGSPLHKQLLKTVVRLDEADVRAITTLLRKFSNIDEPSRSEADAPYAAANGKRSPKGQEIANTIREVIRNGKE